MADIDSYDVMKAKITKFKRALIDTMGNISDAANLCGISRATAHAWVRTHLSLKVLIKDLRKARRDGFGK